MNSGIYILINEETHKAYIGQSVNIKNRHTTHRLELNKNHHPNKYLQNAYNAMKDKSKFKYDVLEHIKPDKNLLNEAEEFWINYFLTLGFSIAGTLYNLQEGGGSIKHSQERKNYMSIVMKGVNTGSKHGRALLKEEDINIIRYCINKDIQMPLIASYFGISESLPLAIKTGKAWTHVKYVETDACYDLERYFYYEQMKEDIARYSRIYGKQIDRAVNFRESQRNNAKRPKISNIKKHANEFIAYFDEVLEMKEKKQRILEYAEFHYARFISKYTESESTSISEYKTPKEFYEENKDLYFALTEASKVYARKQNINASEAAKTLVKLITKKQIQHVQIGKRYFILKEEIA